MSMKISEHLIAAKKRIEKPENWTTHVLARNSAGMSVESWSFEAICWCSIGAVSKAPDTKYTQKSACYKYLEQAISTNSDTSISDFNDTHTHAEVMEMWDKAIALAVADGV